MSSHSLSGQVPSAFSTKRIVVLPTSSRASLQIASGCFNRVSCATYNARTNIWFQIVHVSKQFRRVRVSSMSPAVPSSHASSALLPASSCLWSLRACQEPGTSHSLTDRKPCSDVTSAPSTSKSTNTWTCSTPTHASSASTHASRKYGMIWEASTRAPNLGRD